MLTRSYDDRKSPPPTAVYCDANFLIDVFAASDPALLATHAKPDRAKSAMGLLSWALGQGTKFYASLCCVEECANVFVLGPAKNEAQNRKLRSWKDLKQRDAVSFAAKLADGRSVFAAFHRWFALQQFILFGLQPNAAVDDLKVSKMIDLYAKALMNAHELDAMDAYHFGIARSAGLDWAATADRDWKSVGKLNLLIP
jgi:predicted nucleic acid-binding protein